MVWELGQRLLGQESTFVPRQMRGWRPPGVLRTFASRIHLESAPAICGNREECGSDVLQAPGSGRPLPALPPATVRPGFFRSFQNSFYTSAVSQAVCCRAGDRAGDRG